MALRKPGLDEKAENLRGFVCFFFFSTSQPLLISGKVVYALEKVVPTPGNQSPGQKQMKEFKQNRIKQEKKNPIKPNQPERQKRTIKVWFRKAHVRFHAG